MNPFIIPGAEPLAAGTLFCIGRNYVEHAKELNNPVPTQPMVFLKPRNSIVFGDGKVRLPSASQDVHHEVELVLVVGKTVSDISPDDALDAISGVAIGIDLTARDIQQKAKEKGHPWSVAKGFDTFAPLGPVISRQEAGDLDNLTLELSVNGQVRQSGTTADMIFPSAYLVSYLSRIFTLYPGDLIYTGTPEGVSRILQGDVMEACIKGTRSTLRMDVA
jgi:2-keto-4-pentenoate hydratase/2-oxohepta-3-ene-1,7-dioic acid hydratase in catechol pathway